jgi:hypothetical protein
LLSADVMDDASVDLLLLLAAMEASNDWGECPELAERLAMMAGAEMTGGVETNSTLGERMRWGIRMPGCQSPIRMWRAFGVWMSMPATETESRLSWDVDLRSDEVCACMLKKSSSAFFKDSRRAGDGK